ncbi:MAG: flagellar motor switch protein FliM [Thermosulfidibacteraceae bacterium]|jgi:flagellar motor switch protein FliM
MTNVLTQEEIDALLAAVQEGQDFKQEIQVERFRPKRPVVPYNFRKPDRISKEQLRYLQVLHDRFCRNLSSSLSVYIRSVVEVSIVSIEQITYQEFLLFLPGVSLYCVIKVEPDVGRLVLNIDPELTFVIIDRILGGPGEPPRGIRPFTDLELDLLDGVLNRIIIELERVWESIIEGVEMEVEMRETQGGLVQIVSPNEVVVVITFEVKLGEFKGNMVLCIPAVTLEPIADKLIVEGVKKKASIDIQRKILEHLMEVELELECVVGSIPLTVGEFLSLETEDVLKLDTFVDEPFIVMVNSVPKFIVKGGLHKGRKACLIDRYVAREDLLEVREGAE